MSFPKNLKDLDKRIVNIWRASIDSIFGSLRGTDGRVDIVEEDISTLEIEVEENTEEILATKAEVNEVRDLVVLLIQDLASKGLIDDPRLLQLLNEEVLILQ